MTFGELRAGPGTVWLAAITDFDEEQEVHSMISEFEGQPSRIFYVETDEEWEVVMVEPITAHEAIAWRKGQQASA